jgi:flagellar basal-body rod modification protein FlgD
MILGSYEFFGAIDVRPGGFSEFEFRELDGKVGQSLLIFADDFTVLTATQTAVGEEGVEGIRVSFAAPAPNPSDGNVTFSYSLPAGARAQLAVYDALGRLVCNLGETTQGEGSHAVTWDGRDDTGAKVPSGVYFGRLSVTGSGDEEVLVRRIVITR